MLKHIAFLVILTSAMLVGCSSSPTELSRIEYLMLVKQCEDFGMKPYAVNAYKNRTKTRYTKTVTCLDKHGGIFDMMKH